MSKYVLALAFMAILICLSGVASADTLQAANCSQEAVQEAIEQAGDGDTVQIPPGACTWTSTLEIGSTTSRTKMVKLVGAGTDASAGTRITCEVTCIRAWLTNSLSPLIISSIRFIEGATGEPWAIQLSGHADTYDSLFRIHHNYFEYADGSTSNAIIVGGPNQYSTPDNGHPYVWGLIDNNTFKATATTQGIDIIPQYSADIGLPNDGHSAWANWELSDHQGTWRNVFIEDNLIDCRPGWQGGVAFMDSVAGGTYVFRYNTVYNAWVANHGPDAGGFRSHKWYEIYNNIFALDVIGSNHNLGTNLRGGTGVIFNNQFYDANRKGTYVGSGTDTFNNFHELQYYRACTDWGIPGSGRGSPCDDTIMCGQDPIVGCDNKDDASGWICRDQVGARKGDPDPTFIFGYRWETEPVVQWNNNHTGPVHFSVYDFPDCDETLYTVEERDFLNYDTCSDGVDNDGDGDTDMDDAQCITFWDDVNNNKKGYAPYTYPHPLTQTDGEPQPYCGNDKTEPGEACDGTDLNGYTCSSVVAGFVSGTLACLPDCSGYDVSQCVPGDVRNAASCERDDVQAAIDKANDGDIVYVPAGNCVWDTVAKEDTCVKIAVVLNKSIILKGAGIDSTTITNSGGISPLIYVHLPSDRPVRITGIYFDNVDNIPVICNRKSAIEFSGELTNLRVDNCKFNMGGTAIYPHEYGYGVVDHCTFINCDIAIRLMGDNDASWNRPIVPGTKDSLIVEDNLFYIDPTGGINDCGDIDQQIYHDSYGARTTLRNNIFDYSDCHESIDSPIEAHGNWPNGAYMTRGSPLIEMYNNSIRMYKAYRMMHFRGGSLLIHNNNLTYEFGSRPAAIGLTEEDAWKTEFFDPLDTTWSAQDQIFNSFFWSNTMNGIPVTDSDVRLWVQPNDIPFIQKDRDYWMHEPQVSGGRTEWIDPSRPGADDNERFVTGPNAYYPYFPYVHPHPLVLINPTPSTDTCQGQGYLCCNSCQSGPHPEYDTDCPQVCCESCSGQYFVPGTLIEAEDGELISPMQTGSSPSASGGEYVYSTTDYQGSVSFEFDIQHSGKYYLEARINSRNSRAYDSFFVGLDDEPAQDNSTYYYDIPDTPDFEWDNVTLMGWPSLDPMVWELTKGLHTFTFYTRESNSWLDQIALRRISHRADSDGDGCITMQELAAFINLWKQDSTAYPMTELMEAIGLWKAGTGCL